jgi:hypothetical protein
LTGIELTARRINRDTVARNRAYRDYLDQNSSNAGYLEDSARSISAATPVAG